MSLDDFQLPPFLVEELYKDSLVDLGDFQSKLKPVKSGNPQYLGNNNKHILIIVNDENAVYLPDKYLNFLIEILTACKLTLPDIGLINFHNNPSHNYSKLMDHFKPDKIICLGVSLEQLEFPLNFPYYQVQQYNNQSYLAGPSLETLVSDKEQKLQLWNCLKKLFSI